MTLRDLFARVALSGMVVLVVSALPASSSNGDFVSEPDQSFAAAQNSFAEGDKNGAADHVHKAAAAVRKMSDEVGRDVKKSVDKAGDRLDKLGEDIKNGTIKSADEMKAAFAETDHELAKAWYATADGAEKAGRDTSHALHKAALSLDGAAHWSGTKLDQGAQEVVKGAKNMGHGTKIAADDVGRWFKHIGHGIKDVGQNVNKDG